jgi:phenylpropionate dioxygenase-like ring-hydroxylating dioxygenase large terminal subunit
MKKELTSEQRSALERAQKAEGRLQQLYTRGNTFSDAEAMEIELEHVRAQEACMKLGLIA